MLREKILLTAASLFAQKGFDAVLVDDIAASAGVGKGSVYRQFSSKEELYTESVIEGFVDLRMRVLKELKATQSVPEQVTTIVGQIVSFFWDRLDFFDLLRDRTRLAPLYENRYRSERRKLVRIVSGVLAQGAKKGVIRQDLDPRLLAESLLGMIRGVQRYGRSAVPISKENVVHTVVTVFLDGCQTRRPGVCER